jgi:hypothetical protein
MLFRFITRFVWPILKVTRMASNRMREMQQQMHEMEQKANAQHQPHTQSQVKEGDYIDYEEIK